MGPEQHASAVGSSFYHASNQQRAGLVSGQTWHAPTPTPTPSPHLPHPLPPSCQTTQTGREEGRRKEGHGKKQGRKGLENTPSPCPPPLPTPTHPSLKLCFSPNLCMVVFSIYYICCVCVTIYMPSFCVCDSVTDNNIYVKRRRCRSSVPSSLPDFRRAVATDGTFASIIHPLPTTTY